MNNFEIIMFVSVAWFWFMVFLTVISGILFAYFYNTPKSGRDIDIYETGYIPHDKRDISGWFFLSCVLFTTLSLFIMLMVIT